MPRFRGIGNERIKRLVIDGIPEGAIHPGAVQLIRREEYAFVAETLHSPLNRINTPEGKLSAPLLLRVVNPAVAVGLDAARAERPIVNLLDEDRFVQADGSRQARKYLERRLGNEQT